MNSRYGIFGGSFDPIHIGHVRLADAAVRELELDKLYLMPNYVSPFKLDQKVTSSSDRAEMVKRVLDYNEAFELSEYEINREVPSYTYDTLEYFYNTYGDGLYFILGYDSVMAIDTWHRGAELLAKFPLIAARRPGVIDDECSKKIAEYEKKYGARIHILELEPFDASSTEIRRRAANGESLSNLVLPGVEEYIREHELYR